MLWDLPLHSNHYHSPAYHFIHYLHYHKNNQWLILVNFQSARLIDLTKRRIKNKVKLCHFCGFEIKDQFGISKSKGRNTRLYYHEYCWARLFH